MTLTPATQPAQSRISLSLVRSANILWRWFAQQIPRNPSTTEGIRLSRRLEPQLQLDYGGFAGRQHTEFSTRRYTVNFPEGGWRLSVL